VGGGGRAIAGLLAAAVLIALGGPAGAQAAKGPKGITTFERTSGESKRDVLRYWTRERLRTARPLGVSSSSAPAGGERSGHTRGDGGRYPRSVFTAGEVPDWEDPPTTTHGKVFARMSGVGPYECSATVVNSPAMSLLFTAGHCVVESGRRAKKFVFIPSYRQKQRPFGSWVYKKILVPDPWANQGNFNFDFAAVVLGLRNGVPVEQVTGGRGIAWNVTRNRSYTAYGYPVNRARGQRMWYCTSNFLQRDPRPFGVGPIPSGIGCDMGAGASGGGWIIEGGLLNSVSSFGYGRRTDILYGPYFGDAAERLYRTASQTIPL
jgi:hypothetical protein